MGSRESEEVQTTVERRLSPRAAVTVRVDYSTVDSMFSEFTRNINEGGLFIESETLLALDEQVHLQFRLPGIDDPIKASGRVAWVREAGIDGPSRLTGIPVSWTSPGRSRRGVFLQMTG